MTPERDREARGVQLRKLKARLEAAGLLDKLDGKRPVTLALFVGESPKAAFALRWRRQSRDPHHVIEALTIDTQDTARVICALATNDLRDAAVELLQAVADLLSRPVHEGGAQAEALPAHHAAGERVAEKPSAKYRP